MAPKKTPYGTWKVRWRDPTGRQRSQNFDRQQDAIDFEHDVHVDQRRGTWVDPDLGKITVADWSKEWLDAAHNLRPRGRQTYEDALVRILPALGHVPIRNVTDRQIDEYLSGLVADGLKPSTVHRHYRTLRRMFRLAVQRKRIPESPVDPVAEPHIPTEEMRFLTAVQLEGLADAIGDTYRSLVLVGGWGGLRWGELAGLQVARVDVARNRVHVVRQLDLAGKSESEPKARSRRWVTLPGSVMDELAAHIDDKSPTDLVWTAPKDGPLAHSNFLRRDFQPACVKAGLGSFRWVGRTVDPDGKVLAKGRRYYDGGGITPHDLRHTSVALAISEGAHPKAIQLRMGHKTIQITLDRYGHLFPEMDVTLGQRLDDTRSQALTERRKLQAV